MKALVVGGTGPTGPLIVQGLMDKGYEVTLYHRGHHEPANLPVVKYHKHGDPYSKETFEKDFVGESWDLVVCTYGRLRQIADVVAGRTPKLVAAGGLPSLMRPDHLEFPQGREIPLREGHPTYFDRLLDRRGSAIAYTERQLMAHHWAGDFGTTIFRFSAIYGPWAPRHWIGSIVKRIMDGRRQIIVPGDGSQLRLNCYADNAANQVLLGCFKDEAMGNIFETVDDVTFSVKDSIQLVAEALGQKVELVGVNHPLAWKLAGGYAAGYGGGIHVSTFKQRVLLGYKDVVPPEDGIRQTAIWMRDNWEYVDEAQMLSGGRDPLDYATEDKLMESAKKWEEDVSATLSDPELPAPPDGEWREVFKPEQKGKIMVDGNWTR